MSDNVPVASRPTEKELDLELVKLVNWQVFATHLPGLERENIEEIQRNNHEVHLQKLDLFGRWLRIQPDASWKDVVLALENARENTLADAVKRKFKVDFPVQDTSSTTRVYESQQIQHTSNEKVFLPIAVDEVQKTNDSTEHLKVEERKLEADEIAIQLVGLHKRFAQLETNIKGTLESVINEGQKTIKDIARYLERHLEDEQLILTDSKDIDDLFHKLHSYYSFLDCELLEEIVEQFVQGDAQTFFKEYVTDVEAFEELTTLQELKDAIEQALLPTQSVTPSTCEVILKVGRRWKKEKMRCLNKLLEHIFSKKRYLLNHIKLEDGSLYIRFLVPKSQVEMLIALAVEHMEFMYLLGVFEMMINDIPVLMEDENMSFALDSALLESSQSGNNEAVQFLLDLGVNINYSNSEGKTALMLASEAGHEEVVQTLVSAGANVNLQDSVGQTALMLASGNVDIIHCLLLANANLDIQRQDGNTALHIACYKGHSTVIKLLLSYHASPVIKNTKDDTPFMASVRGNNADILKRMIDAIPSSHLSSGIVLACRLGHSAVFSLLVKQLESTPQVVDLIISCAEGDAGSVIQHIMEFNIDPNTTLISGITPLMIASSCGHVEVINTLVQMEADVNRIDTDNYSPLAYAITGNKSLPTVQFLLEAGANPHVLLGGTTILERAYREEGQQDICDILFKFSAVDLQKRFTHLLDRIEEGFDHLIGKKKDILLHVSQFLEVYPEITGSSKVHDSTDLFSRVQAYSDFLSYEMLVALTREFLQDEVNIQEEFEKYLIMTRRFENLLKIQHFENVMAFLPQREETTMATTTCLVFKLNRQWSNKTLKNIRSLCSNLLSDNQRYLSHMTVDIVEEVPCIKFLIPNSTQIVEDLISEAAKKRELIYLLGVFEMMINDIPVLMEDENENFTFDSALLESSQSGNNEAVQFLLDLGVNVNSRNSMGKTALMLASDAGHEEVVQTLVPAEANVNLQDSAGETALMLASENIGIIRCLLLANAKLDIQRKDGNTALHIACYRYHNLVIELLLSHHASSVIKNTKDDTPFMASVRGNNADILKLMLDAIPSSHLSSGIVLACRLGHSAVFSLLVKQLECTPQVIDLFISCAEGDAGSVIQHIMELNIDPNTTLISGITPLMIASSCGHVEVINTLVQMEADVNRIDTDNYSPLAYAITGNKSLPTVQFLLEAGANPHVLLGGTTILERAYREEGQQDICDILFKFSAVDLQKRFTHLLDRIEEGFDHLIGKKKDILLHVSQFLEVYPEITGSSKVHDSTDLFSRVQAYSDFLSYEMLVALTREFLQDEVNIQEEFEKYLIMTRRFENLLKIQHFENVMAFLPQREETTMATTTCLVFKLNRQWSNKTLKNIRSLCSNLFCDNQRYLSHMTVDIVEEVPCIKFLIPNSTQIVEDLISEAAKKRELIYLLGVFEMMINDIPVLMEDENENFTFDSALLESSQSGNNEAVQFLLDLGVNVNSRNSEGKTALMLACEAGHEEVVQTLVPAEANVNLQDSAGETALMLASENIGIIRCLLLANAKLDIQRQDGNTALHIACYRGHNTVIKLLLSYHASPVIKNTKDDTPFMASVRGNNADILKLMIDAIPSSHLSSGIVLACRLGHSAVFSLLVKQLECTPQVIDLFISCAEGDAGSVIQHIMEFNIDPNTTLISGITPLMIASSCGHVEVIDTLVQMEADVNRIDTDNYSPLAYAITGNKSLPTVQYLLEAGANPHILLGGITILERAYREEGQQDICYILFKFSAVDLQKRFTHLLDRIEEGFDHLIGKEKDILLHVSQFLEVYPQITGSSKVHDSTDLFSRVRAYSDFLSYELLVVIAREFLKYNVEIQEELEEYLSVVQKFEELLKIEHFANVIAFLPQQEQTTMATTTYLVFKLNRNWSNKTLKILHNLYSFLFSDNQRYLSHMTVDIVEKVPCIKFLIPNSTQIIEDLISEVAKKRELMYLLGVFEMMINNTPVLMEDEDKNFTFELALQKAVQFGNKEAVQLLLDLSNVDHTHDESKTCADPHVHSNERFTALILASECGNQQIVELLLEKQVDPNVQNSENGVTALILASQFGHYQVVEILLKKGADPNIPTENGETALIFASMDGHCQVVEILLQKGADPNIHDNVGWTPLIVASQCGNQQVVELLLEKQVDLNVQNGINGKTALIQASENGHYQVVEVLLKKGADPNIHDNDGWTALIVASENGHQQVLELLLEKQVDPNVQNSENGVTALILASQFGHYQVVEILLKKGADPNIHDNDGWTPLIVASQCGNQQVVELLLEKQVDLNVQNGINGKTALIQASENGHYQVVEVLLKKGADPNIHDNDGWTALILASENGHQQVVELLLEKQVDPNVQNSENGRTALIQASQEGHYQVVEILLKKGADPNIHDNDGWTALILASENGHQQVVELLLEKQVDPNVQNSKNGRTALIQASQFGHYQVVEILLKKVLILIFMTMMDGQH